MLEDLINEKISFLTTKKDVIRLARHYFDWIDTEVKSSRQPGVLYNTLALVCVG